MTQPTSHAEQHAAFELYDIYCLECADAVVLALRAQARISSVHLDWAHNRVHVIYHGGMITPAAIEQVIASAGCSSAC
jgi:copper chaperone CopZ